MGFYPKGCRGTMRGPVKFNPMASSITLFRAMRGVGTDKQSILEVVACHTASQRRELKAKYKYVYKKNLREVLDSELSFAFGKIVDALMAEPEDYVVECIHRALTPQKSTGKKLVRRLSQLFSNGLGKDEYVLIDLLCYKSNKYLEAVKKAYKEKFEVDLDEQLSSDEGNLPQDFRNIIQDMLTCERDESEEIDEEQLAEDSDDLVDTDCAEVALQAIFQERSYSHIRKLAVEFRKKSGKNLETMIEESGKFSQEQKSTYLSIFLKIKNEYQFYAERLRTAIDGMGRDDDTLVRIVVLRSELDLLDIMDAYKEKYGIDLATNVAKETSGEYKEILMKIIRVPGVNEPYVIDPEEVEVNSDEIKKLDLDENAVKALMEEANGDDKEAAEEEEDEEDEDE